MLRKISVAMMAFVVSSISYAMSDIVPYIGLELGLNHDNWQVRNTTNQTYNFASSGGLGGAFAGLGLAVNQNIYAGLEGFFDESSASTDTEQVNTTVGLTNIHIRARYNYGASFIPGLIGSHGMLFYARLGFAKTRFVFHQVTVPSGSASNNDYHTTTGGQAGLGFQWKVAKYVVARGEYDYTSYRNFTSFSNKTSVRDNQFKFGVAYLLE